MQITAIGDSFIDRYHLGTVRDLSAEAPIPIIDLTQTIDFPGGAANVRQNLISLGVDGRLLFPPLSSNPNYPIKNRLLTGDTQLARWDERDWCNPFQRQDLLPLVDADGLIICDYGKGSITDEIVGILREAVAPTFVDTKSNPTPWLGSEAILFPNLKEYNQFKQIYEWFPRLVLKCGPDGLRLVEFGRVVMSRPAVADFVKSVNGAGDTVIAAFAVAYMSGGSIEYALEFANAAAAIAVESPYTTSVKLGDAAERYVQFRAGGSHEAAD